MKPLFLDCTSWQTSASLPNSLPSHSWWNKLLHGICFIWGVLSYYYHTKQKHASKNDITSDPMCTSLTCSYFIVRKEQLFLLQRDGRPMLSWLKKNHL